MTDFEQPNVLLTEDYPELMLDLEVLYIPDNMSGRLKFRERWPIIAERIFDKNLIARDVEGLDLSDSETTTLEDQAEQARTELYDMIDNLEERCLNYGVLKANTTRNIIEDVGQDVTKLIFVPEVIEKAMLVELDMSEIYEKAVPIDLSLDLPTKPKSPDLPKSTPRPGASPPKAKPPSTKASPPPKPSEDKP